MVASGQLRGLVFRGERQRYLHRPDSIRMRIAHRKAEELRTKRRIDSLLHAVRVLKRLAGSGRFCRIADRFIQKVSILVIECGRDFKLGIRFSGGAQLVGHYRVINRIGLQQHGPERPRRGLFGNGLHLLARAFGGRANGAHMSAEDQLVE